MKKFFALMASAVISAGAFAQLPNGSVAPDFTATDINGVEHNLYSLLDSGLPSHLRLFCHMVRTLLVLPRSGVFSELYNTYGPDGTDEIRVIKLESDDTTTAEDLNGTGTATQGDWVTGTPYTIIDNASKHLRRVPEHLLPHHLHGVPKPHFDAVWSGFSVADHAAIFQANNCQAATLANDGALVFLHR